MPCINRIYMEEMNYRILRMLKNIVFLMAILKKIGVIQILETKDIDIDHNILDIL